MVGFAGSMHAACLRGCSLLAPAFVVAALLVLSSLASAAATRESLADVILLGGKVVRFDAAPAQALAVRDGRIVAIGGTRAIRRLAGPATRVIDLGGRTVIPGLIDSHIHAIRAGLTWQTEVSWIGAKTLVEALGRLRAAALRAPKGTWLVVAGGWTEQQFAERRRPTQAEIAAAAPDHAVYVQRFYSDVLLTRDGLSKLGVASHPELASRLQMETDAQGVATGWLSGDARTISDLYDLLPRPDLAEQVAGTRAFFRELNALGVTGVIDPGGYNFPPEAYQALFRLWREGSLSLRVVYSLCAPRAGSELEDFARLTAMLPMGWGDDWLRFNGIGENVAWGMYNNDAPNEEQKLHLLQVLRWAAARGLGATFHWNNDRSVRHLLDVIEEVDRASPVAPLRWSVAHLNDATPESLARMKKLGLGWLVQNAFYFRGEAFLSQRGIDAARMVPPMGSAARMGLHMGGGTDAHRVMSPNPFVSLQWMLDARTVAGTAMRAEQERPDRVEALRLYTEGSAWFAHDESRRGALAVGKLADLAVLDQDYLTVPVEQVGTIRSQLTMVGGRIVYATGPYHGHEARADQEVRQ